MRLVVAISTDPAWLAYIDKQIARKQEIFCKLWNEWQGKERAVEWTIVDFHDFLMERNIG